MNKEVNKGGSASSMSMMAAALDKPVGEVATKDSSKTAAGEPGGGSGDATPVAAAGKPAKAPKDTGPKEIKTVADLTKAIWGSRGALYAPIAGYAVKPLAIVKSDLTNILKDQKQEDPAPFNLVARPDGKGADLVAFAAKK